MAPGLRSNENTDDSDERGDNDSRISAAERREIRPNHYVFGENETGDLAFVVMEGTVEIVKQTKNSDVVIATVRKGGMFGEMALIEGQTANGVRPRRKRQGRRSPGDFARSISEETRPA